MNWSQRERLYQLLPAIYRIRDGAKGEPLRALLSVIESELETIEADIEALYDNWFIETCDPWVVPYIGDLVGNKPLHETVQPQRADVANTLYYRRRKATPAMLEELARDVTGWGAHVVEFFHLLAWTQHVNHNRYTLSPNPLFGTVDTFAVNERSGGEIVPLTGRLNPNAVDRVGTVNLRNLDALDRLDGPFDELSHTVDVRPAGLTRDRYNLRKVGFFLWRLQSYAIWEVTPKPSTEATEENTVYGYHISPIGAQAPLFNRPKSRQMGLITEIHTPGPIRPLTIHQDLERCRIDTLRNGQCESGYVAEERSLWIIKGDNDAILPEKILIMDLEKWRRPPPEVKYQTASGTENRQIEVGIDIQRGRMAFAEGKEPSNLTTLKVSYNYGFSANLGGGPYRRTQSLVRDDRARSISVAKQDATVSDLNVALADWTDPTRTTRLNDLIIIKDNATYILSRNLRFRDGDRLVIQADDGNRPTIRIETDGSGGELLVESIGDEKDGGSLVLAGVLVEGGLRVKGLLSTLAIMHSTLIPGRRLDEQEGPTDPRQPSIIVDADSHHLELTIAQSIVGRLRLSLDIKGLTVRDSIIDALGENNYALAADDDGGFGPATTLERVTIFGQVYVRQLTLASEVIFTAPVTVLRRQAGCVRFSYVPLESITPRRYRCQPDLEIAAATERRVSKIVRSKIQRQLVPNFTSTRYGDPAYAQLGLTCPIQIRTGAENGSEMGVFNNLRQPQREANLRQRLEEYLPFGLEPVFLFVT